MVRNCAPERLDIPGLMLRAIPECPPGIAYRFTFFFELFLFFGTLAPFLRASERPIAIACLRLLTLRPERPLLKLPFLRFFIVRLTLLDAFFEYFRAMNFLRIARN